MSFTAPKWTEPLQNTGVLKLPFFYATVRQDAGKGLNNLIVIVCIEVTEIVAVEYIYGAALARGDERMRIGSVV